MTSTACHAPRSNAARVALLSCLVGGAALRFVGLTKESFWIDEGWLLQVVDHESLRDVVHEQLTDVHPILPYALLWAWMRVFGNSDAAVRSLAALFATAAIPAAWLLLRRLVAPRAALVATAIVALSPFLVRYAHDGRQYSLLLLLATLSTERFLAFVQGRSNGPLVGWALVTILLAYTHVAGATAVLAQDALLLWGAPRAARSRRELLRPLALGHAAVALAIAPWLPFMLRAAPNFQGYPGSQHPRALWRALVAVGGTARGTVALLGLAALGFVLRLRRGRPPARGVRAALVLALIPLLLPWIVSALAFPSFASRLVIHAVPPLAAALGAGLVGIVRPVRWRLPAALAISVLAMGIARLHPRVEREQWREAAALIASEAGPRDAVLALGVPDAILLRRYLPAGGPLVLESNAGLPAPGAGRLFVVSSVHTLGLAALRGALRAHGWREGNESPLVLVAVHRFDP